MMSDKKVMKGPGDSELPPPGDARREELKKRQDMLNQFAEELAQKEETGAVDPKKLEVDRELAQHFDKRQMSMLYVSNRQPGWEYTWQNDVSQAGLQVIMKKTDGWEVVCGNDPEAMERRDERGYRRVGDCILMKIPTDRKKTLDERDRIRRERFERGSAAELEYLGRKMHDRGLHVHTPEFSTLEESAYRRRGFSQEQIASDPRRRMVQRQAREVLGEMSRERIPGVPLPGEEK